MTASLANKKAPQKLGGESVQAKVQDGNDSSLRWHYPKSGHGSKQKTSSQPACASSPAYNRMKLK